MDLAGTIADVCARAKAASRVVGARCARQATGEAAANEALRAMADGLRRQRELLLGENEKDLKAGRARDLSSAMLDRLALDSSRIDSLANAILEVAALPSPVGGLISETVRPNGLRVRRVRAPLGVIAMIYEARPNVTAEASALCLKAGNAVVLRGGSEALHSNVAIAGVLADALAQTGFPRDAVQVLPFPERDAVRLLVQQAGNVDLAIPRGGEALIRFVTEHARVPVVQHYKGVCHLYVDAGADVAMATALATNGKLSRPGVCNALEGLLIDETDAARLLPPIARALQEGGCELRGCSRTRELVPTAKEASPSDYGYEFLERVIAVRVVSGLDGALDHITNFGSGHTEVICTANTANAERFRTEVDAACVAVNASSRFHDGGELGLGAEIGIATSRLHWRGPMGLEALTTMKWVVDGDGQVR